MKLIYIYIELLNDAIALDNPEIIKVLRVILVSIIYNYSIFSNFYLITFYYILI